MMLLDFLPEYSLILLDLLPEDKLLETNTLIDFLCKVSTICSSTGSRHQMFLGSDFPPKSDFKVHFLSWVIQVLTAGGKEVGTK